MWNLRLIQMNKPGSRGKKVLFWCREESVCWLRALMVELFNEAATFVESAFNLGRIFAQFEIWHGGCLLYLNNATSTTRKLATLTSEVLAAFAACQFLSTCMIQWVSFSEWSKSGADGFSRRADLSGLCGNLSTRGVVNCWFFTFATADWHKCLTPPCVLI